MDYKQILHDFNIKSSAFKTLRNPQQRIRNEAILFKEYVTAVLEEAI